MMGLPIRARGFLVRDACLPQRDTQRGDQRNQGRYADGDSTPVARNEPLHAIPACLRPRLYRVPF